VPVTLAQAALNTLTDLDFAVIDNFRRYSWLLDHIPFDDCVTPGTGGATLTYGYTRLISAANADFRAFNTEYTPGQAVRSQFSVNLKPLGGSFTIDRALANLGDARTNEEAFQLQQVITSTRIKFEQELILGDTAVNALGFDGLSKALTGTTTEKTAGYYCGSGNWNASTVTTQALANVRLDELDDFLSLVVPSHTGSGDQGVPGALPPGLKVILGNTRMIARIKALARWASMFTSAKDDLGRQINMYGDWVLVDIGDRQDGASPIIPITSSATDLYAVSFGLDAFHAVAVAGSPMIQTWPPNYEQAGAVKSGEVEMGPLACVLKNTKAAGVLRTITVQ
jgi:hypothetical protein